MRKLTFSTIAALVAVLLSLASTAAASHGKDSRDTVKVGKCSATSHAKLKVKSDDGRLETEFEVDQNRAGKRWRVTITRNGSKVFRGSRTTQAPSGSFEVRRLLAAGSGSKIVATAKALSSGETCRAAISL